MGDAVHPHNAAHCAAAHLLHFYPLPGALWMRVLQNGCTFCEDMKVCCKGSSKAAQVRLALIMQVIMHTFVARSEHTL